MTGNLKFGPSGQEECIKLIRKLRWIGLQKEADRLQRVLSEAGDAPETAKLDVQELTTRSIFECSRKENAISELEK